MHTVRYMQQARNQGQVSSHPMHPLCADWLASNVGAMSHKEEAKLQQVDNCTVYVLRPLPTASCSCGGEERGGDIGRAPSCS